MTTQKTRRFRILKPADLASFGKVQTLPGTPFTEGGFHLLLGAPGTYKSFLMLAWGLWAAQRVGVCYIAAEGHGGFQGRIEAWQAQHKLGTGHLLFICETVNLRSKSETEALIAQLKAQPVPIRLVIFDTYARCLVGGDENSAKDAGLAVMNSSEIQRALGAAVCWVHHTRKADSSERGSSAPRGAADGIVEVTRHENGIKVKCGKSKDLPEWLPQYYRFQPVLSSGVLLPASEVKASNELSERALSVLEFLNYSIFDDRRGATARQVCVGTGIAEASVYRILADLKNRGLISQGKRSDPYSVTAAGGDMVPSRDEGKDDRKKKTTAESGNSYDTNDFWVEFSEFSPSIN